jgi:threonine dehydratase
VVLVTDDEILAAMKDLMTYAKLVVEPGGAAGLAALSAKKVSFGRGESVAVVISGGNVDLERLKSLL